MKEKILLTRSYITTALAKITEQLTAEANKPVNTAKENIIHQFAKTETKKRNKKQTSDKSSGEQALFLAKDFQVVYPVVVVNVDRIKCRALLHSGPGSSYISSSLANRMKKNPF